MKNLVGDQKRIVETCVIHVTQFLYSQLRHPTVPEMGFFSPSKPT